VGATLVFALMFAAPIESQSPLEAVLQDGLVDALISESDLHWHRGDYCRAAAATALASELAGNFARGYVDAAWLAWNWGCRDAGAALLDLAVARFPSNADLWQEGGTLARMWGEPERAQAFLRRAYELAPEDRNTCAELAAQLRRRLDWEGAAEVYRTLLRHHPDDAVATMYLERYQVRGDMLPADVPEPQGAPPDAPGRPVPTGPTMRRT